MARDIKESAELKLGEFEMNKQMNNEHTPGPWKLKLNYDNIKPWIKSKFHTITGGGLNIARIWDNGPNPNSDARRIVACINACEGISNEALESGVIKELLKACKQVLDGLTDSAVGEIKFENEDERFGALLLIGHLFKTRGKILESAIAKAEGK